MSLSKKLISIVIVTYNSSSLIRVCLESIISFNDIGDSLEVIIVDNNSDDYDLLVSNAILVMPDCKILRNKRNGGYGQGNNIGIKQSSGSIIMIMNPDVTLFKPIFKDVLKHFENSQVGLLGGSQYENLEKRRCSFVPLGLGITSLIISKFYRALDIYNSKFLCIHGACFFIRKSLMSSIGYYDENIFLYNEELDIQKRIQKHSQLKIIYDKSIGYMHPMEERSVSHKSLEEGVISLKYYCNKFGLNFRRAIFSKLVINRISQLKYIITHKKKNEVFTLSFIIFKKILTEKTNNNKVN